MLDTAVGLFRHRRTIASMGSLALAGLRKNSGPVPTNFERSLTSGRVPHPNKELLRDFMRVTQADAGHMKLEDGTPFYPPTFYVTWAMGALADAIVKLDLPYDYARVLHAASEVTYLRPLCLDETAEFATRVTAIDDNERRAKIRVEAIVTERDIHGPEIFRNTMELFVPKPAKKDGPRGKRPDAAAVGEDMRAIADLRMPASLGRKYALVSGDFNPVHWSRIAARSMGFKSTFVQGYCTKAMTAHAIIRQLLRGAGDRLVSLRVEFKKPVLLPAKVSVFVGPPVTSGDLTTRTLAIGKGPAGEAYVTGDFSYR